MNRFLLAPPIAAVILIAAGGVALAQGAFPAPLPGRTDSQPSNPPAATPVNPPKDSFPSNGAPPMTTFDAPPLSGVSGECEKGFALLRELAERESKSVKAASRRGAPPYETCSLIFYFRMAETRLLKYVERNAARCAMPAHIAQQLKAGVEKTEAMETKACTLAREQSQKFKRDYPRGDFFPSSTNAPI